MLSDCPPGEVVTEPDRVLDRRSSEWAGVWMCSDQTGAQKALKAIAQRHACPDLDTAPRQPITTSTMRACCTSFKAGTSIGLDCWSFRDIARLPDPALSDLVLLLEDIRSS